MEILLGRNKISPDQPDMDGQAPPCCAAQNGNEGVVKCYSDRTTSTLTNQISTAKHHSVVLRRMEMREDINCNKPDNHGLTSLCCPTWNGHEGVVRALLGWGEVDPSKPD